MKYKHILWFIGECLTLDIYPEKIEKIRKYIQSENVDWEQVVWRASDQLVLPAFYLNLKRANLLSELPDDLIAHLEEITRLNKERNLQIIDQANQIIQILNKQNITPIFLKGTAYLLSNLYADIAERMINDIDFLLEEDELDHAANILLNNGYKFLDETNTSYSGSDRHYPRLVHKHLIASIEIHKQTIRDPYAKIFGFKQIVKEAKSIDIDGEALILSPTHNMINNMMTVQMNDKGFYWGVIYLRHMYDLLLLSRQQNPLEALSGFGHYFNRLNAYLSLSFNVLGKPSLITHQKNWKSSIFVNRFNFIISHPKLSKLISAILYISFRFYNYMMILFKVIISSEMRALYYNRIGSPGWFRQHLLSYKNLGK